MAHEFGHHIQNVLGYLDRAQQDRIELLLGSLRSAFVLALQIDEHRQLVLQNRAGAANRFFRVDRAVGLDVQDQLVQVRALLDTRALDRVGHAADRAERRIELQTADRAAGLFERGALDRRAGERHAGFGIRDRDDAHRMARRSPTDD